MAEEWKSERNQPKQVDVTFFFGLFTLQPQLRPIPFCFLPFPFLLSFTSSLSDCANTRPLVDRRLHPPLSLFSFLPPPLPQPTGI